MKLNWYLFGGYTVIWTVLFLFLVFLNSKQKRLQERLSRLAQRLGGSE